MKTVKPKRYLPVDYIVVSVLANMKAGCRELTTNAPDIHKKFYDYKKKKLSILKNIAFDTSYSPYSELIAEALDNIELAGLISRSNPMFRRYDLKREKLETFYNAEVSKMLNEREIKQIHDIAKGLETLCSNQNG